MKYSYKIYSSANVYLGSLDPEKVGTPPAFSSKNGGQGQLKIDYLEKFDDFDQTLITGGNLVKVYGIDDENPLGNHIFTGFISRVEPFTVKNIQGVKISVLGLVSLLTHFTYTKSYSSTDIQVIFQEVITSFNTKYGTSILSYDGTSLPSTGNTITLDVDGTMYDVLNEVFQYCPENYFWRIDPDGKIYLQQQNSSIDNRLTIGKQAYNIRAQTDYEQVINKLYLEGDGISDTYEDATSQSAYGLHEKQITVDTNNTDTLDDYGNGYIANYKDPLTSCSFDILAENYDILNIKIGDTFALNNYKKDTNLFNSNMMASRVDFKDKFITVFIDDTNLFGEAIESLIN